MESIRYQVRSPRALASALVVGTGALWDDDLGPGVVCAAIRDDGLRMTPLARTDTASIRSAVRSSSSQSIGASGGRAATSRLWSDSDLDEPDAVYAVWK